MTGQLQEAALREDIKHLSTRLQMRSSKLRRSAIADAQQLNKRTMVKKLEFLSTVEVVAQAADTTPPIPDLVGNDWKYWAKTTLPTSFMNSSEDGVLLLEERRFVRIAWKVRSHLNAPKKLA